MTAGDRGFEAGDEVEVRGRPGRWRVLSVKPRSAAAAWVTVRRLDGDGGMEPLLDELDAARLRYA